VTQPPPPRSHSCRSLHQDLLTPWPEELKGSSLLSGESTHSNLLLASILPTLIIGGSAVTTSRVLCLQAKSSDPRDPTSLVKRLTFLGVSGPRAIAARALYLRVPKSRDPRLRDADHFAFSPFVNSLLARLTFEPFKPRDPMSRDHPSHQPTMTHAMHVIFATSALAFSRPLWPTYQRRPREAPICPISE
jgi:hypothetical protein